MNSIVTIVVVLVRLPFLPDGNLDALVGEGPTQRCAFDDTWELLRGEDLERIGEDRGQDWAAGTVEARLAAWIAHVNEIHLEPRRQR